MQSSGDRPVQVLKPMDALPATLSDGNAAGVSAGQGSGVAHLLLQREATDNRRIRYRLAPFCRVDDEVNLPVLEQV